MTAREAMAEGLLPCPLCGPGDTGVYSEATLTNGIVRCSECNLVMCCNTEAEAITAWNRRAPRAAAAPAEVAEAVKWARDRADFATIPTDERRLLRILATAATQPEEASTLADELERHARQAMEEDTKRNHLLVSMMVIDNLPDILRALRASGPAAGQWRDIASDPPPKTAQQAIMLFGEVDAGDYGAGPTPVIAAWSDNEAYFGEDGGWQVLFTDNCIASVERPTHWQPLPTPPALPATEE